MVRHVVHIFHPHKSSSRTSLLVTSHNLIWFIVILKSATVCVSSQAPPYELKGVKYPLVRFDFLDTLNVPQAFSNRFYMKFLLKCVFFEGHCDIMGKWLKPRAMAGIFGECLVCTEHQKANLNGWLELLIQKNPEEFRAAMIKICVDLELPVQREDLKLIESYYTK